MSKLPSTHRRLVAKSLSPDFQSVAEVVEETLKAPPAGHVLVKIRYAGVNATDVNMSAGRYAQVPTPPIPLGLEGVGLVVELGQGVSDLRIGQAVAFVYEGCYSEYLCLPAEAAMPVPSAQPEYVGLLVSGLTAALALDRVGEMADGESVLITGAAGGTGQLAVQLAKARGCKVAGTCSTEEKAELLKRLGCDRPILYTREGIAAVAKAEFPNGFNLIYEGIGGDVFDQAVESLAIRGRLVVIGFVQGYKTDAMVPDSKTLPKLPLLLLAKSGSLRTFMMMHFATEFPQTLKHLVQLVDSGKLKVQLDFGQGTEKGEFKGLESVPRAVQHLHSKCSIGKIVVDLEK